MKKNINIYTTKGETTIITIINRKNIETQVIVDTDMVEELKNYSFRVSSNGYVKTGKCCYIHQLIMGKANNDKEIDHINRNKLDNRKSNLRMCTHKENCSNRYKYEGTGITKLPRLKSKPYQLRINGKHIGYFKSYEEALKTKRHLKRRLSL